MGLSFVRRWLRNLARRWSGRQPSLRDDRRRAALQLEQLEVRVVPSLATLASFSSSNGLYPNGVILDSHGNLFGTTSTGGAYNDGTIFEVVQGSTEHLHSGLIRQHQWGRPPLGPDHR